MAAKLPIVAYTRGLCIIWREMAVVAGYRRMKILWRRNRLITANIKNLLCILGLLLIKGGRAGEEREERERERRRETASFPSTGGVAA